MGLKDLRGSALTILVGIVGATCFALQGYDQAVVNGLLTLDTWTTIFPLIDTGAGVPAAEVAHHQTIQGLVVAIYELGCTIGALSCYYIGRKFGRKKTTLGAGVIALVGIIIQSSPFSLGQLIAGRIITGLAIGAFTATVPMWVSESTKAETRGRLVMLQGFFAIGGIVIATWLEFGFYYINSSVNWRFPVAFQSLFAMVILSLVGFIPESPRWLIKADKIAEARTALSVLNDIPENSEEIDFEISVIQQALAEENHSASRSAFALSETRNLHRTILALLVNICAQMSGINIITFYSDTIFQNDLGYSGTISRIISASLQVWQFIAAGLGVILIDRLGRRPLLLMGSAGMFIATACLAGLASDLANKSAASASIFFYFMALFFFPTGLFLVPFMYAAEIAPLQTRAQVTAMSAASNWIFNFLIAMVTPVAFGNIGYKYYIVYACINFSSFWMFYFFYPETKRRTLEEIDAIFIQSKNIFDPVRVARTLPYEIDLEAEEIRKQVEKAQVEYVEIVPAPAPVPAPA
ncbi:hexose transporter Hxt13p [Trichomonascus vanleenenianus]|uniref:sugar porter family MFS transporter n=1 Tax=Trichomonascus vanleenenianus TaxID=2268995 RepID=UPI003ECAE5B8